MLAVSGPAELLGCGVEEQQGHPLIPQLRLDDLLAELQVRLQNVLATRDRTHALLEGRPCEQSRERVVAVSDDRAPNSPGG